jgi:hypothetical protein
MELNQAKAIIEEAINIALQKGCYNLKDVATIITALQVNSQSVSFEAGIPEPLEEKK